MSKNFYLEVYDTSGTITNKMKKSTDKTKGASKVHPIRKYSHTLSRNESDELKVIEEILETSHAT